MTALVAGPRTAGRFRERRSGDTMETLTTTTTAGLPVPPFSAADVALSELPTVALDESTSQVPTSPLTQRATERARQRNDAKADEGTLHGSRDSVEAHVIGYLGELVAETTGLPLDQAAHISPDGDPGWDHDLINNQLTLDTKATATTTTPKPKLVVTAEETPPADLFLLVHIRRDKGFGRVIGFIDRESLTNGDPKRWPGDSLNYVADWSELYPPRFITPLIIGRAVAETRGEDYIDEKGCQLCGAHLDEETETRRYIEELGTNVGVCSDICISLLDAARDQGRVTEFKLYERP